jgi:hypothetical protein
MRRLTTLVALAVALAASTSEAAKPTSKPAGGKPAVTKVQTQKSTVTKPATVKGSPSKGPTAKGTSAKTTTQVAKGGGQTKVAKTDKSVKSVKADAKPTKAEARTAKAGSSTTTPTTDRTRSLTSPSGTATPAIDFTATKVGQKLEKNSALRSKIEAKLQAAGYTGTAYEAAYGFKNLGQLNAATNQVQNQGMSFDLLKVLMTGTYVDPVTHNVYRTQKLPNGTTQLVKPELATNTAPTQSLGQAKQTISGGAVMPEIVVYTITGPSTTTTTTTSATGVSVTSTAGKSKPRKNATGTTTQPGGGNF